ncbi:type VI secretion system Vgr family protein [Enterobacteriaceae bacterium LUAb1]
MTGSSPGIHHRYQLIISNQTCQHDVLQCTGHEQLSQPFRWRIEFNSPLPILQVKNLLMQEASLALYAANQPAHPVTESSPLRTLCGIITACEHLSTTRDQGHYAVTLEPRLALLARSHQNAIYQQQSVPEIVESILRERHGMRGQDFLFALSREYPKREQVMQYAESDLAFISRLLSEVGIWYRVITDPKLHIDVVAFYDDQTHYQRGLTLPVVAPSAMNEGGADVLWDIAVHYQVVEKSVTLRDYHWQQAQLPMDAHAALSRGDEPATCGEASHYHQTYQQPGEVPQPESGAFYAQLIHERYLNGQTRISGRSNTAGLLPGMAVLITQAPPDACAEGMLITAVRSDGARDRSFTLEFEAIPCTEHYGYRPAWLPPPVMAGTLPARVTSTTENDIYAHIDTQGRYRVRFDFDRSTWKAGQESMWVQQAKVYAGEKYGLHAPLLAGTAVAIGFEKGNPDRPYIAHALHDARHPEHVTLHNYRRNVWRTPANNKLRLDDTRGEEHIKLATEFAKSQLSIGHLVNNQKQPRGAGFELRSDAWGSIRAGQGLFISADSQPQARGDVLEMRDTLQTLQQAQQLSESLHHAASIAKAELADLQTQASLLSASITEMKQAVLLLSAPAGIAAATPQSLQLSAGKNLIATSQGDTDFSVLKSLRAAAGEAISLFAQKLGIRLFAAQGKVELEAQNDAMSLRALKEVHIRSEKGKVVISAQDELVLMSGNSYLRLKDGIAELGAPDKIIQRTSVWQKFGGQSVTAAMNTWQSGRYVALPEIHYIGSNQPAKNQQTELTWPEGRQSALSSTQGKITPQHRQYVEDATLTIKGRK